MSCCGARHLPAAAKRHGICRPLPLAHLASSATGGARIAPHRHVFLTAFRITHSISGWIMGCVCIFAFGENKSFARSSPREQRAPALPLIVRVHGRTQRNGTPEGTRTPDLLLRRQLLYPTELLAHINSPPNGRDVERVMGIEPTRPAWKAGVLPLNYTREGILMQSA